MRLIDADDAIYELERVFSGEDYNKVIRAISRVPTIYAVTVVHGKWTMGRYNGLSYCSICGTVTPVMDAYGDDCICPNYCPNCGAKMDGGKDDDLR